jgi:hypothetical protein
MADGVWFLATSSSFGTGGTVVRPRSGTFPPKDAGRVCMGGGFRSVRPMSALERNAGGRGEVKEREAARQFAIMSVRVRGLVPTFPDGSQAVVEPKTKVSRVVGAAANKRKKTAKGAELKGGEGLGNAEKAILSVSEEYIENLHLQLKILEKQLQLEQLNSASLATGQPFSVRGVRSTTPQGRSNAPPYDALSHEAHGHQPPKGSHHHATQRVALAPKSERMYRREHKGDPRPPAVTHRGYLAAGGRGHGGRGQEHGGGDVTDSRDGGQGGFGDGGGRGRAGGLLEMESCDEVAEWVRRVLETSEHPSVLKSVETIVDSFRRCWGGGEAGGGGGVVIF